MIADIHSNIEALKVVIKQIQGSGVDRTICLGDIVGYGPNPKECIELIKTLPDVEVILGNHDAAVINKTEIKDFNEYAKQAIEINKGLLTEEDKEYLTTLKEKHTETDILFVHGSPRDPLNEYLLTMKKLQENIELFNEKICFGGHTHLPLVYSRSGSGEDHIENPEDNQEFKLLEDRKYIINVGSVGQPRDGDNRACFVYYDTSENKITYCRLKYDIESVQKKMKNLQLPKFLINRLSEGK